MNTSDQIFADMPDSIGAQNVLRRAKQLAELCWTPVKPLPAGLIDRAEGQKRYHNIFLPPWRPQTGANYSAARFDEKYIGFNVSIETYMTALSNPDSVLYTRSLHGRALLSSAFYGTVCSEFVSYVMDMPFHIDCQQWPFLDGIEQINPEPLENLRLCDIILERTSHIALITGIHRDKHGKIVDITVTESTLPNVQSKTFSPKAFTEYWLKNNEIFRYHKMHKVTYTPNAWIPLEGDPKLAYPIPNPVLMPDYGNKANYLLGEEVTISVFDPCYTAVEVFFEGEKVACQTPFEGKVILQPEKIGFYQVVAVCEGQRSEPVEFAVVDATVTTDKQQYKEQEKIQVSFSCETPDQLLGWVVKTSEFAKYWGYPATEDGTIPTTTTLPQGKYLIISLYQNKYGVYSSKPCPFEVSGIDF